MDGYCRIFGAGILNGGNHAILLNDMKNTILSGQADSLHLFADQIETRLETSRKFIYQQLSDNEWYGFDKKPGDLKYEQDKMNLKNKLDKELNGVYASVNLADGIFGFIRQSGQTADARKTAVISMEEYQQILTWVKADPVSNWEIQEIGEKQYLVGMYRNIFLSIGVFVKLDTIYNEWGKNSEYEILLIEAGKIEDRSSYYTIETAFQKNGLHLVCYIPKESISSQIPLIYFALLIVLILIMIIGVLMFALFKNKLVHPLQRIVQIMREQQKGNQESRVTNCESVQETQVIQTAFNELMDTIYDLKIQTYEMEIENQKSQLMNLQLQINPHLLLNAMNTVYSLAEVKDYENVQKFSLHLVRYFRYALKNTNQMVRLSQELDFIQSYVEIQKIRYPGKFYYLYDVEDELLNEWIPPLMIENFVENSIKYSPKKKMTEIVVIVRKVDGYLNISICDDGPGIDETVLLAIREGQPVENDGEVHVGIWNCRRRLMLFYGGRASFSISSSSGGTQVFLKLPVEGIVTAREGILNESSDC